MLLELLEAANPTTPDGRTKFRFALDKARAWLAQPADGRSFEDAARVAHLEGRIEQMQMLLRRGLRLMDKWQVLYGDADNAMRNDLPLPPAGQVEWAEDVDAVLGPAAVQEKT